MSFLKKWKGTALGAVAAPFTGGVSLAGGYLYDTVKQQNEANKKAVDRANAYDMYTWDLANQYNDPKAQMARLKAAGLNPNLVYGSGNVTGNTAGVASSNGVASQEGVAGGMLSKGLPLAQGLANLRNTNSQNELLHYQMGQTKAQTNNLIAQTARTEAETRNLNNFLDGEPSTYDTWGKKMTDNITRYSSKFGDWLGDKIYDYTQWSDRTATSAARWTNQKISQFKNWWSQL